MVEEYFGYFLMLVYGIVAGLLASIPLGPIGVLCIQRTLSGARSSGFISGLGAATADTVFATLAIFALSWITGFISKYEMWVEALGGLLVVIFGLSLFLQKPKRGSTVERRSNAGHHIANYISVLFLTLPNPAYFFVFVAIFAAMGIGVDIDTAQKWIIISGVMIGASAWWFILTWVVSKFRKNFTVRKLLILNKISGGIIILLGAYAVLSVVYRLIKLVINSGSL